MRMTGGQALTAFLEEQGVDRVFCVPGESYLAVLDALHDSPIETIVARQEGGAAMMAEADGKLTGQPGVCFVTRGPGATNAASGVHVAKQDSTPMILFIGQVARAMRGREAFQEVDYRAMFGGLAKWVDEVDSVERLPEILNRAWRAALSGRPGPVVVALPEDMLRETAPHRPSRPIEAPEPAPTPEQVLRLNAMLAEADNPFLIVGGSRWSEESVAALRAFAEERLLPVGASFRRQGLFDHLHPNYAGDIGLGMNPALKAQLEAADLLVLLGGRLSEIPSQSYQLQGIPWSDRALVHIHPDPAELGRVYAPDLAINAAPGAFLRAMNAGPGGVVAGPGGAVEAAHAAYLAWSETPPDAPGAVQMGAVMAHLRGAAPDAILTNGAGNYATWIHRFWRFRRFSSQIAPTSGSMGYGLPAAIAAKLRRPEREVICFAGDGCLQMTIQELGTAAQVKAGVIVLVADNGIYGTIRMHQERDYPGRVSATDLINPNFAAIAHAYGGHGETVRADPEFADAFARARIAAAEGRPAVIHLVIDPEAITPTTTLSALRAAGQ